MRRYLFALAVAAAAVTAPSAASAQADAAPTPTLDGDVVIAEGDAGLTLRWDAAVRGGWQGLHLVEAVVLAGGAERETLSYDVEDAQLSVGEQRIVVGTGDVATGTLLEVRGADVVVTTGGAHLQLTVRARLRQPLPEGARVALSVTSDTGEVARIARVPGTPASDGGVTWDTVLALVLGALFVGALLGNLFAPRRRTARAPSIYATLQRRLDEERRGAEGSRT